MPQKILILAAIPYGLRLDREIRDIEEAIRRAARRDLLEIRIRTAVRPQDIRRAIAEEHPQIVHFCGHGLPDGSLVLEDNEGNNKPVSSEGLVALFKLHADYVNCVLLNACHSAKPAEAISQYINYAIGMNREINDKAAVAFSQGFYDALGYEALDNRDIFQRAFDEGLVAIQLENILEEQIPVLKKKNSFSSVDNSLQEPRFDSKIKGLEPSERTSLPPISTILRADYNQLRDLLKKKAWQEADLETVRIILHVARRSKEGWLRAKDLKNFSCSDICMIDQLWIEASQGQFGFSVQRNIWFSIDGQPGKFDAATFRNFGDSVGWRVNDDWLRNYTSFNFSQAAPKGHLPSLRFPHAEDGMNWLEAWQDNFKNFLTLVEGCLSRAF
ncbi:MAG: GUN4 domain-containing protein [Nostoc sp. DedQUE04]|uniref:GUN4 domain-containing protein n=1 Tax=Nostoc sp. DedQUE04 TaxID=3075390 RepID=UPI002AD4D526|nr:GUN4 domain-containing protein [Nostoc sp. DedQUE04]MDZ8141014.1 GUN4 domain-containing protein [Nostoc sp. DedQUE04]